MAEFNSPSNRSYKEDPRISPTLINGVQTRNHATFEHLYEYYKIPLWRRLYFLTNNQEIAHDLFQETFLRAWKYIETKSPDVSFDRWLFRIAHNLAIDHLRSLSKFSCLPLVECKTNAATETPDRLQFNDFEDVICDKTSLHIAIAQMTPQYRSCVLLQDLWGYSQLEIAALLGLSKKTVGANISRGHKQLRTLYSQRIMQSSYSLKGKTAK